MEQKDLIVDTIHMMRNVNQFNNFFKYLFPNFF
jgi:hypothetical protein